MGELEPRISLLRPGLKTKTDFALANRDVRATEALAVSGLSTGQWICASHRRRAAVDCLFLNAGLFTVGAIRLIKGNGLSSCYKVYIFSAVSLS
jgi:hypothetical protein